MSKKFIQSKLPFSSQRLKCVNEESGIRHLKRKLSDRLTEKDMGDPEKKPKTYAAACSSSSSNRFGERKNTSSHSKGNNYNTKAKQIMKDEAEGSSMEFPPFLQTPSGEIRSLFTSSESKSHSQESTGTSSNFTELNVQSWDADYFPSHKPYQDHPEGSDYGHNKMKIEKDKPKTLREGKHMWKGVALNTLKRAPECLRKNDLSLPPLIPTSEHKVFFDIMHEEWGSKIPPTPFSDGGKDIWDDTHVHMPYSEKNSFTENGSVSSRWNKIREALEGRIIGSFELEVAILSYNPHYRSRWNFDALHRFFEETKEGKGMKDAFFLKILPEMQKLALQLPELCPKAIPILKQGRKQMSITLSQQQIACLLANAFFCTFPKRNFKAKNGQLPDINFSNLFSYSHGSRKFEKFRCIINYFQRVTNSMPTGTVTYTRQNVYPGSYNFWKNTEKKFTNLHVSTSGTIEDDGRGMLQADFANKYVGGGVLSHGLVQEEIRFLICPEMILSRLFTEVLADTEVLVMTGCERFSNYEGYSESFKFSGNHEDETERDEWGRRFTEVVAMDALVIRDGYKSQFQRDKLFRELNKAYCAFKGIQFTSSFPAVCTGNWGCGAFGGDKQLKALIQMMAASAADRDVCYFTFGDSTLCDQLGNFYQILKSNDLGIWAVIDLIKEYKQYLNNNTGPDLSLFEFITCLMDNRVDNQESDEEIPMSLINGGSSVDSEKFDTDEDFKASTP